MLERVDKIMSFHYFDFLIETEVVFFLVLTIDIVSKMELISIILSYQLISHKFKLHRSRISVLINTQYDFELFLGKEFSSIYNHLILTIILVHTIPTSNTNFYCFIITLYL